MNTRRKSIGPEPEGSLSTTEFQKRTGLNASSLSQLVARGVIPKLERGRFPDPEALRTYCEHLRRVAAGRGIDEAAGLDLSREKALLMREQRRGHELKNRVIEESYISADDVEQRWTELCVKFRYRILAIPSNLPQRLPHLSRHDLEVIDRECRDALTELADATDEEAQK